MDTIANALIPIDIETEMRNSYLDYSMSVIIGRALPDVRDGLKPVHRRILYAMFREGNLSTRRYSKCAGVVGEVLKKYHPHGDSAVYDALVRMAQPWNMRLPLVDGQGNFGSIDGDPAAAYRYTECRMTKVAEELLADIDKDTVRFAPNFDGSNEEPEVLPAAYPNLLVNGSDGIAVGMATKIPPHNLAEVINGVLALIANPDITVEELIEIIPGPDFPTAGTIYGRSGVFEAYRTGRGRVVMRGRATFEETATGGNAIIIDELPYQVNKARLVEQIADLVRNKKIDGIRELRDESDRQGMRIVIELKRDAVREIVLNHLFKHTALQSTFGVNLLAIVHGQPMLLTLREMLSHYLSHRRDVTIRRCRYDLRKAEERKHILEGYLIALDNLDAVIALIRASATPEIARHGLMDTFSLSEVQAQAILDMRLQRLTGMEREKIESEYKELEEKIAYLRAILDSEGRLLEVIGEELTAIRDKYSNDRRTRFEEATGDLTILDLIADEEQVITLSLTGYIKRTSHSEYSMQRRGGFGKKGMKTRELDQVSELFTASTHSHLLIFTTQGQVFKVPVYTIPETSRTARGTPIVNLVNLDGDDEIASVISVRDFDEEVDLFFCSKKGLVKRTRLGDYRNIRSSGLRAYDCADGDELLTVRKTRTEQHVLITTRAGKCIRFQGINDDGELEVRHMGRVARGVRGIKLKGTDEIAGLEMLESDASMLLLTVTENGYGKRTAIDKYRVQGRGGQGVINMVVDDRNGLVVGSVQVHDTDLIMMMTNTGRVIKIPVVNIRETQSRAAKGVRLMRVEDNERIVSVTRVVEPEEDDELLMEELSTGDEAVAGLEE
ncbi:MAG: DNA gyrase subunit A [Myxococcota bacterium]|nr:DNA gyrase subunit A [Myxococcota bacterium]MEC9391030.1 DNA gyrase subunit A [Myxococcota bacterium]